MLGWLAKKGESSRVYMCIKTVKWDLETGSAVKRATVLALAQLLRAEMLAQSGIPMDVLDRPLDYSRNDLLSFYDLLETARNQNTMQIEATKKNMRHLGMELPQFAVDHAKTTGQGLEVWMCTLGAGIVPERRDDVRTIWSYLAGSLDHVGEAISHLREVEQQTAAMTGIEDTGMFSVIDTNDWTEQCGFVPSVFSKELHLD
ncbi:MAG: hypothetical protein IH878_14020 [Gemmatimonadetes bacterium]|nr:hypothetical protein [Gemmatimonadota bacterium]